MDEREPHEREPHEHEPHVRVVGKRGCAFCAKVRRHLRDVGVSFVYEQLDPDDEATYAARRDELIRKTEGHRTFPFVFNTDGSFIGGFNETVVTFPIKLTFDSDDF